MELALVEREELEAMAAEAGYRVGYLFGDYARAPFEPATSPVMIWELIAI